MRKLILALGAVAALCGLTIIGIAQAQTEPVRFSAYPSPGTDSAVGQTQISFRGGDAAALGAITVRGSRSGTHPGALLAHSDGLGVSFIPQKAFTAGETVTVTTDRDVAGAASGDFSFGVGDATTRVVRPVESPMIGRGSVQSFKSRPDLDPPAVTVTTVKPGRAPGLVFLAPKAGRGQDGPMIIDDAGKLVWFKAMKGQIAADFRAQTWDGKPVLTWWEGRLFVGDGDGVGQIYDSGYQPVATVRAGRGYKFDLHEFTLTPRGTALIPIYQRFEQDLSKYGGPKDAQVVDSIVQEIDVRTGLVVFEWHSLGNVALTESNIPVPKRKGSEWEYFHINSVADTADGNLLVSARNTSGVYKIDRVTGKVLWRLGGKKSDFKLGPGVRFDWQHSARELPDGTINIYDNSAAPPVRKASRAIVVRLDPAARTATLVSAFTHPKKLLSASQGNVELLPNGNTFVGWGSQRWFTEFSPTGQVLFDGRLARGNDNYRAFRFPWSGLPAQAPKLVATSAKGKVSGYVSWNGATGVARWELLAGPSAAALAPVAQAARSGFETALSATTTQPLVAARALDAQGNVLATSAPVKPAK